MSVSDGALFDIVKSVWATVVSIDLELLTADQGRDDEVTSEFLCAWMESNGGWEGGLLLSCQESLAREAHSYAASLAGDPKLAAAYNAACSAAEAADRRVKQARRE